MCLDFLSPDFPGQHGLCWTFRVSISTLISSYIETFFLLCITSGPAPWWFCPFCFQYPGTAYDADDYVNVCSSLWRTSLRLISLSGIPRRMETILKRFHTLVVMLHWPSKGIYTYSVIQLHSSLYFFPLWLN